MQQITNISALLNYFKTAKNKFVSIELCTNRDVDMEKLSHLHPPFCSVTWMPHDLSDLPTHPSIRLAKKLQEHGNNILLHLPGRILDPEIATSVLNTAQSMGITNIFAMQGENALVAGKDVPRNNFPLALDLVNFIKQTFGNQFSICVTGYPDGHPRAESPQKDLEYLKAKADAGANFVISQAIFDVATFQRFYNKCKEMNLDIPILPGIYIINSHEALLNMVRYCKISVPEDILKFVADNKDNEGVVREYGIGKVVELIQQLFTNNEMLIPGVHIFSLNDLELVEEVFKKLNFCNVSIDKIKF